MQTPCEEPSHERPRNVLTSAERHEQLKAIAAALGGLSIAETLGHLINAEIARGTIPDTIPGVTIKRVPDGVYIALDPDTPALLTLDGARKLAELVRDLADPTKRSATTVIDLDHRFSAGRKGNGVQITVPFPGSPRSFSRDLARDLARLLLTAADSAPVVDAA